MNDYTRYLHLAEIWKNGTITPDELRELEQWYGKDQDRPVKIPENIAASESAHSQRLLRGIYEKIHANEITSPAKIRAMSSKHTWLKIAAAVLIITASAIVYYSFNNNIKKGNTVNSGLENITAGTNRAMLTLSDGKKVELSGQAVIQDGRLKIKNENDILVYQQSEVVSYNNTMSTPNGGQYKLHLPDGSKVWLNAASSITYPTAFTGKKRTVQLTGEAYFEIAQDRRINPLS